MRENFGSLDKKDSTDARCTARMESQREKLLNAHADEVRRMLHESIDSHPEFSKFAEQFGDYFDSQFLALNLEGLQKEYGDEWKQIENILSGYLRHRGRALRGLLMVNGYNMFTKGQGDESSIYAPSAGIEMAQDFAVTLDDVMDRSPARRKDRSFWKGIYDTLPSMVQWDDSARQTRSTTIALNVLPLLYSWSRYLLLDSIENEQEKNEALIVFNQGVQETMEGQAMDLKYSHDTEWPTLAQTLEASYKKTGPYSFWLPLRYALLRSGEEVTPGVEQAIRDYAKGFGLAYQLKDDLLIFATAEEIGKDPFADAKQGTKTPLVVLAHEMETDKQKFIDKVWGHPDKVTAEVQGRLLKIMDDTGAHEGVLKIIKKNIVKAREALKTLEEEGYDTNMLAYILGKTFPVERAQ